MSEVQHGGRLDAAVSQFGGKAEKWVDLSTGINPASYPIADIDKRHWHRLPDQLAWNEAAEAARMAYGATDQAAISLAAGSQAHIQLLPTLFKPQDVAIVGFTYQEHSVHWRKAGHQVFVTDGLESAEATARIIVVVNPNNPDGRITDRTALLELARRLAAKGGLLVVDEAFGETAPRSSVADQAGRDGLIVLRSLGKFYGLAGVRFGVALTYENLARRLEEGLGPWAVSGPALAIAAQALQDSKWQKRTSKKLVAAREQLEDVLLKNGHEVVGGTGLFVLTRHGQAERLWTHLAKAHILTRSFSGKPEWIRFGLPGSKAAFNKLDKALADFYAD